MNFWFLFNLVVVFMLAFAVLVGMYFISFLISFKSLFFEKISSYECGFDSSKMISLKYSITFFSIILVFIIFELEIIIFVVLTQSDMFTLFIFFVFFLYVVLTFYMEWYFGKLVWQI
uniref:NADH dehydrogenase subunit 3 n=1 Tax=Mastophorus muris TaxID=1499391 RepID=UPI002E772402|nr:NADH dehydrogenase subunit 3 [Mastophorus muris]WPN85872.1 NADH dehydrogenase subunit 3 [Mastophorus muris]